MTVKNQETRTFRRDLGKLVGAQAIYYGSVSVDLTLSALAGLALAPTPLLATLPLTLVMAAGLGASFGAGMLATRLGYRRVMALGAVGALVGGLLAGAGALVGSFALLCVGSALVGVYRATGGYIRYLAADLAPAGRRERALSTVLYGGLISAFAGPFVALGASTLLPTPFVGSFLLVAALGLAAIPLALTISREPVAAAAPGGSGMVAPAVRLRDARRDPNLVTALVVLPVSAALMTLVMAIGPLANEHAGGSEATGAVMIQWHLVAMFAPALFTGELLRRWGPRNTSILGAGVTAAGAVAGVAGTEPAPMIVALILAGLGWNLLFLAGTAFLVRSYPAGAGGRLQAVVESATGIASVLASLLSAVVFDALGWQVSNAPVLLLSVALAIWLLLQRRDARAPHTVGTAELVSSTPPGADG